MSKRLLLALPASAVHSHAQITVELSIGNRCGAGDVHWLHPSSRVRITYEGTVASSALGVVSYSLPFAAAVLLLAPVKESLEDVLPRLAAHITTALALTIGGNPPGDSVLITNNMMASGPQGVSQDLTPAMRRRQSS